MRKIYIAILVSLLAASCVSLDIPPKDIVTDDDLMSSQSGLAIYMARLYTKMPWEDFKYIPWNSQNGGFGGQTWLGCLGVEGTGEAVCRESSAGSFTSEATAWWGLAFTLIRQANHLIETLPESTSARAFLTSAGMTSLNTSVSYAGFPPNASSPSPSPPKPPHKAGFLPTPPHQVRFPTKVATPSRIPDEGRHTKCDSLRPPSPSPIHDGLARREIGSAWRRLQKWQLFRGSCSFCGTRFTGPGGRHP